MNFIQQNCINKITAHLQLENPVFFLFGAEIEFYIIDNHKLTKEDQKIQSFYQELIDFAIKNDIVIENLDQEDGFNQFEIQIQPNDFASELANNIVILKSKISQLMPVDFNARPFQDMPSNGLHFHISLYDNNEYNLFQKIGDQYSGLMYNAVGGLLEGMPNSMDIFAPTLNCKERYKTMQNSRYIQFPTGYNWGFNNRTCAIRIPQSNIIHPNDTRIENRICSPMADPDLSIHQMLVDITNGIVNKITPPEPIFGNAFDKYYDSKLICN